MAFLSSASRRDKEQQLMRRCIVCEGLYQSDPTVYTRAQAHSEWSSIFCGKCGKRVWYVVDGESTVSCWCCRYPNALSRGGDDAADGKKGFFNALLKKQIEGETRKKLRKGGEPAAKKEGLCWQCTIHESGITEADLVIREPRSSAAEDKDYADGAADEPVSPTSVEACFVALTATEWSLRQAFELDEARVRRLIADVCHNPTDVTITALQNELREQAAQVVLPNEGPLDDSSDSSDSDSDKENGENADVDDDDDKDATDTHEAPAPLSLHLRLLKERRMQRRAARRERKQHESLQGAAAPARGGPAAAGGEAESSPQQQQQQQQQDDNSDKDGDKDGKDDDKAGGSSPAAQPGVLEAKQKDIHVDIDAIFGFGASDNAAVVSDASHADPVDVFTPTHDAPESQLGGTEEAADGCSPLDTCQNAAEDVTERASIATDDFFLKPWFEQPPASVQSMPPSNAGQGSFNVPDAEAVAEGGVEAFPDPPALDRLASSTHEAPRCLANTAIMSNTPNETELSPVDLSSANKLDALFTTCNPVVPPPPRLLANTAIVPITPDEAELSPIRPSSPFSANGGSTNPPLHSSHVSNGEVTGAAEAEDDVDGIVDQNKDPFPFFIEQPTSSTPTGGDDDKDTGESHLTAPPPADEESSSQVVI
ncbi:hypothetical protein DIPPA_00702 [Diplonema papillatum]|nr:hypothetical protein DIPPA_00702 [Diplonema papillatum]